MIIIAENLNSSIPSVYKALEARDTAWIRETVGKLDQSSAAYLDVNAGTFHEAEADVLKLLISETIQITKKPLVLDSPDPEVIRLMASFLKEVNWKPELEDDTQPALILNSITLEEIRFQPMLDLALANQAGLVGLLMAEDRMPEGVEERLDIAGRLISRLNAAGIPSSYIFLDPMIRPVAADDQAGLEALTVIKRLKEAHPDVHLTVGLSNISFGLPARRYLNRAFLLMGMAMGLDSAILNPLDQELMALCKAAQTLQGQDEYCMNYLDCFRPPEE